MINKISIKNYKSIQHAIINCGQLNIVTGVNGSGKTSFLQSLLLLRQSFDAGNLFKRTKSLLLNYQQSGVSVGTFRDILCAQAPKENERIKFQIDFSDKTLSFESEEYNQDNRDLNIVRGKLSEKISEFEHQGLFNESFKYLAAERIEPAEDYPRFQSEEVLGKRGEYTAHYIEKYGPRDINIKALSLKDDPQSYSLNSQISDWMTEISESIEVSTKENLSTNRIELSYRIKYKDGTPSQNQKPQNIGFGITHTLPIIVAILTANQGDLIIIENPETHLHPRAQTRLATLFALAAQNGVQLFVETHSDHIINGVRLATKKGKVGSDKIYMNFFTKDDVSLSQHNRILMDKDGGLSEWPKNFFDEWDNALTNLI